MEVYPETFGEPSPQGSPHPLFNRLDFTSSHDCSSTSLKATGKKIATEEELQAFCLRPRFNEEPLQRLLQDFVNHVMDMPIQYYESLLYNCTRTYVDTLSGQPITLSCLSDIHQIYSLKQSEHYLTSDELLQLNDTLETLLEEKPTVFEEYKLVRSLTELLSGLIVHLGLYSRTNYHYRQQPRVMHVRTLDLGAINSRLQSMDTLWLATVAEKPPVNAFISETTKQLAAVLVSATESVFRFALRLNAKDFRTQPRIDTYLVTKVPKLRQILHVDPQYFSSPPPYQELSLSTSCMSRCFRSKSQRNLDSLRELISDQDFAFRAFEEAVLANFVV